MWNSTKSVKLSLALTYIFIVLLITVTFTLPMIVRWYVDIAGRSTNLMATIMVTGYICIPFLGLALLSLRRLLTNIIETRVFIDQNVQMLRRISWCCVFVSGITLIAGRFYLPFLIIGIAAAFFAMIIRVIKNVFRAAIVLKAENDMTI